MTNGLVQYITEEESAGIQWVKEAVCSGSSLQQDTGISLLQSICRFVRTMPCSDRTMAYQKCQNFREITDMGSFGYTMAHIACL